VCLQGHPPGLLPAERLYRALAIFGIFAGLGEDQVLQLPGCHLGVFESHVAAGLRVLRNHVSVQCDKRDLGRRHSFLSYMLLHMHPHSH